MKFSAMFLSLATAIVMSQPAQAQINVLDFSSIQQSTMIEAQLNAGLTWKVGDKASYKIKMGFINGSSNNFVREDLGTELWVVNEMDLGMAGKQMVEILFNKADGQVKKILVGGKEQQLPNAEDYEVVEMKQDQITVAAGTFQCIYVKVRDKKKNEDQEAWLNPKEVPMSGMLKSKGKSPFGAVTQELQSFSFATP